MPYDLEIDDSLEQNDWFKDRDDYVDSQNEALDSDEDYETVTDISEEE